MSGGGSEGLSVKRVVVWRHGRTTWNAGSRYQGQADPPLDPVGEKQSRQAAAQLATEPPELIVTSDLLRATRTADALSRIIGTPVKVEPGLREIDVGSWQGLTRGEVAASYPDQYAAWMAGRALVDRGGETKTQLDARVLAALRRIEVEHVLLVTHGGTSRSIFDILLDLPAPSRRWLAPLGNSHWSELHRDPGGWRLQAHNVGPAQSLSREARTSSDDIGDADAIDDGAPRSGTDDEFGARA